MRLFIKSCPELLDHYINRLAKQLDYLVRTRLWVQIIVAMVLGIGIGLALSPTGGALVSEASANMIATWLALPGRLFLALIQMVVIPLVLTSVILGVATSGNSHFLRRIGMYITPYFISTTLVAVLIGSALVLWIQPGQYFEPTTIVASQLSNDLPVISEIQQPVSISDRIIAIVPANPTKAILHHAMFQVVVFSILIAVALVSIVNNGPKLIHSTG